MAEPSREISLQTIAEVRERFAALGEQYPGPDEVRRSTHFQDFVTSADQAATSAMACDIEKATAWLVRLGVDWANLLNTAEEVQALTTNTELRGSRRGGAGEAVSGLERIRNEYVRIITEAIFTGCDCLDADGRRIVEGVRAATGQKYG